MNLFKFSFSSSILFISFSANSNKSLFWIGSANLKFLTPLCLKPKISPNGEIVLLTDQQGGVDGFNDVPEIIFLVKKEKWGKTKDEVGIKK